MSDAHNVSGSDTASTTQGDAHVQDGVASGDTNTNQGHHDHGEGGWNMESFLDSLDFNDQDELFQWDDDRHSTKLLKEL